MLLVMLVVILVGEVVVEYVVFHSGASSPLMLYANFSPIQKYIRQTQTVK